MPPDSTRRAAPDFDRERLGSAERPLRRRRRPAPDWGGDELFDQVPRRRFARDQEEHPPGASEPHPGALASAGIRADDDAPPARLDRPPARARANSVEQRITRSPDRLAALAFALGLLLILVAIATSL